MPTITAKLVGQSFNQGAKAIEDLLRPGREVLLVREHNNPYGKEAIEVYVRLGHVNRETATLLVDLFDDGTHPALPTDRSWVIGATLADPDKAKGIITIRLPDPQAPKTKPDPKIGSNIDDEIPF